MKLRFASLKNDSWSSVKKRLDHLFGDLSFGLKDVLLLLSEEDESTWSPFH
jgi:hypothetical protein